MEHLEQFEELSLLWDRGNELCLAIVGPSQARNHLLERIRAAAIHHIEMVGELAVLWVAMTYAIELVLGRSPDETFRVELMDKVVAQFRKLEELCSQLEQPSASICDLLLGPPPDQARWADRLDEAIRRLEVELTTRWQVDAKLEALQTLAAWVWDLVLDNIDGPSSLLAYLSMVVKLLEGQIDVVAANGVCWGTRSALVTTLSHFLELKSELELLGPRRNVDLIEDQTDALWPLVDAASDSLASLVPSSIARDHPDEVGD
jgi:hypothetical protein